MSPHNRMMLAERFTASPLCKLETLESRQLLSSYTVDNTIDESDGNYSAGDLSLREAIELANANLGQDTILFSTSTFSAPTTITLGLGELAVSDELIVNGLNSVTVDGNEQSRVFNVFSATTVTISDLTISDGRVIGDGGAILTAGHLTLNNVTISDSYSSDEGGGIFNSGTLYVNFGTISRNHAVDIGGGIHSTGTIYISDTTVSSNTTDRLYGGGIYNDVGWASIHASTIHDNHSGDDGGGLRNFAGTMTVTNSTISGNSARDGGGIGINTTSGEMTRVINTTIIGNTARINGGGVHMDSSTSSDIFHNTIIAGNNASMYNDVSGLFDPSTHNLIGDPDSSGGLTDGVDGNIVGDGGTAVLSLTSILDTTLADNGGPTQTYMLLPDSRAVHAGSDDRAIEYSLDFDQRGTGYARFLGAHVDIGAVEFGRLVYIVDTLVDESDGDYTFGDLSLREAIQLANGDVGESLIVFDANLFTDTTLTLSSALPLIRDTLTISGAPGQFITIDADRQSRVLDIEDSVVTLERIGLTRGDDVLGGGLRAVNSKLTILNSAVMDNDADYGAGVHLESTTLTMTGSVISDNRATDDGGALHVTGGSISISESTISNNYSSRLGGGIYYAEVDASSLGIANSTISGNTSGESGGGLYVNIGSPILTNVTMTGNHAAQEGGGIFQNTGATLLRNTIVAGNTSVQSDQDISGTVDTNGLHNLIGDPGSSGGLTHGVNGNIVGDQGTATLAIGSILDPLLLDHGGNTRTHALVEGSLAIDSGDNQSAIDTGLTLDQRGDERIFFGNVDIGAYEFNLYPPTITSPTAVVFTEDSTKVAYTITATDPKPSSFQYAISRWDKDLFNVDAASGEVTFKTPPDYDNPADSNGNNVYVLWVSVTDEDGQTSGQAVTITVQRDTPPVITSPDSAAFLDGDDSVAYTITANDDGPGQLTYAIGRWDKDLFDVDSVTGEITFKSPPDINNPQDSNANNVYVLWVSATDTDGNTVGKAITIQVFEPGTLPIPSDPPTLTSPDAVEYLEGSVTPAYSITADDDTHQDRLIYSISRWDADLFEVDSVTGEVTFKTIPYVDSPQDSNANNVYVLQVSVTDVTGQRTSKAITIKVVQPAFTPVITSPDRVQVSENQSFAYLMIVEEAAPGGITYSLTSRWDSGLFEIDSRRGSVTFKALPDYENPVDSNENNVYIIWVNAIDARGNMVGKAVLIEVLDAQD